MSIKESFATLLSNLQNNGVITEEAKNQYLADFEQKLEAQSAEADQNLEKKFNEALNLAVGKICEDYDKKIAELEMEQNPENPENQEEAELETAKIHDAFSAFLASLPMENIKAFNDFTASLSDEQKELFKIFISGDLPSEENTPEDGSEQPPADDNNGEQELEPEPKSQPIAPEEGTPAPEDDGDSELVTESMQVIAAMSNALKESGLDEVSESILSEASSKLNSLAKKHEREYEKFLKASIKNLTRKNKEMLLSGGLQGGLRRLRNADVSLQQLRKKLYLTEKDNRNLSSKLFASNERVLALEANERSLTESAKAAESETAKLKAKLEETESKNSKLNESVSSLRSERKNLTEQIATVQHQASINEAKAYLVESTATLSPDLRNHLLKLFEGKSAAEIKSQLNEAVEAYNSSKRDLAKGLRKPGVGHYSRPISEAVHENNKADENDPLVMGFANLSESVMNR